VEGPAVSFTPDRWSEPICNVAFILLRVREP
jgi:hypothetical protein